MRPQRPASALLILAAVVTAAQAQTQTLPPVPEAQRFSGLESNANPYGPLLPLGRPVDVQGVQAVCTARVSDPADDPRWASYPLKLEFAAWNGAPLAFAQVSVKDEKDQEVVSVRCPGARLLLGLPAGEYHLNVAVPRLPDQLVMVTVPRKGQKSMTVRFPMPPGGGAISDSRSPVP